MRSALSLVAALAFAALTPSVSGAPPQPSPHPANCTVEPVIVGNSAGMPFGDGYRVIVRDAQVYLHDTPGVVCH